MSQMKACSFRNAVWNDPAFPGHAHGRGSCTTAGVPLVHGLAVVVVAGSVAATSWPLDPALLLGSGVALASLALALPAGAGRQGALLIGVAALAASHAASSRTASPRSTPSTVWPRAAFSTSSLTRSASRSFSCTYAS